MSDNVQLPALGESVTEGTVTRWLKNVGDTVEVDEPLLEISTDKVDTEIPSPFAGVLEQILVQEDETVEVGATSPSSAPATAPAPSRPQEAPAQECSRAGATAAEQAPAEESAAEAAPAQQPVEQHEEPAAGRPPSPPPPRAGRARTSRSPRSVSPSPRAPSPAGSRPSGTRSRSTSRCSRSRPTRSTRRSRRRSPARCSRSWCRRTRPSRSAPSLAVIGSGVRARASPPRRPRRSRRRPLSRRRPPSRRSPPQAAAEQARPGDARAGPVDADARPPCRPAGTRALGRQHAVGLRHVPHPARPQARGREGRRRRPRSSGTGVGGRIRKEDVLDAAAKAEAEKAAAAGCAGRPAAPRLHPRPSLLPSRRSPRCAAPPRRPAGCARSSPSAWSTPCTRRRSSPRWSRST